MTERYPPCKEAPEGDEVAIVMKLELQATGADAAAPPNPALTEVGLLRLEYFAPPPDVLPFVTTYFRMRCDEPEIRDVQPATVGILAVTARGSGHIRFLDGRTEPSQNLMLLTPLSAAAIIEIAGPWHTFGAALSPLGWAALTRLSAAEHGNRLYNARAILAGDFAAAADRITAGFDTLAPELMVEALSDAIRANLLPVPAGHIRLLEIVKEWLSQSLSPRVSTLAGLAGMSQRQVQRLVDRYFGLPPKALARKYRALRVAALLSNPDIAEGEIDAVADHFYDQSHMIREIRLFAGRTPARIASADTPYLSALLDLRNFREISPRIAPLPTDLRA